VRDSRFEVLDYSSLCEKLSVDFMGLFGISYALNVRSGMKCIDYT